MVWLPGQHLDLLSSPNLICQRPVGRPCRRSKLTTVALVLTVTAYTTSLPRGVLQGLAATTDVAGCVPIAARPVVVPTSAHVLVVTTSPAGIARLIVQAAAATAGVPLGVAAASNRLGPIALVPVQATGTARLPGLGSQ